MNKQAKRKNGVIVGRGIEWTDYTWNPISGCFHACQWTMPDGSIANCYAEDVAHKVAQSAYPHGFEHHYWNPRILAEPLRVTTPSRIFVGSMADVFGHWVADWQIAVVLSMAKMARWHSFQFLTKNPVRAKQFNLPPNAWVGASSPPDFMWNKPLSSNQQVAWLDRTMRSLADVDVPVRWMSFEPLSRDYSAIIREYPGVLKWAVIGAASNGSTLYAPNERHVRALIEVLDEQGVPVFFKGNMRSLAWAQANWREEFPGAVIQPRNYCVLETQLEMFGGE